MCLRASMYSCGWWHRGLGVLSVMRVTRPVPPLPPTFLTLLAFTLPPSPASFPHRFENDAHLLPRPTLQYKAQTEVRKSS